MFDFFVANIVRIDTHNLGWKAISYCLTTNNILVAWTKSYEDNEYNFVVIFTEIIYVLSATMDDFS